MHPNKITFLNEIIELTAFKKAFCPRIQSSPRIKQLAFLVQWIWIFCINIKEQNKYMEWIYKTKKSVKGITYLMVRN